MRVYALTFFAAFTINACSSSSAPTNDAAALESTVRKIGVVAGDPLGDAIAVEMFNSGFKTFELPASQELDSAALQSLAARGIEAVLVVRSTTGYDTLPESATIRMVSIPSGETIAAMNWSNSHAGHAGSPLDRMVRKSAAAGAEEIVKSLKNKVSKRPAG